MKSSEADPGRSTWSRSFAVLVAIAGFMELFDGTVIQTALPALAREFGISPGSASVTMAAYFAAAAGVVPVCAWLTTRLGVRASLTAGILLFTFASLACGLASNLWALTMFRIVQGIGGAVMLTVGQIAILRNAPKDRILNVTAYLVWPALAAPVVAPLVGGLITDSMGWRWLFYINLPVGLLAAAASIKLAKGKGVADFAARLDIVGALLLAGGLCTLVPSLMSVEQGLSGGVLVSLVAGGGLTVAAVVWLLRAKAPLLNLGVFDYLTFRASNSVGLLYRLVVSAIPVLLTLMFQTRFGWSATHAGALVMVLFAGNLSIKPFANYAVRRFGYRLVLLGATLFGALVLATFAFVKDNTSLWLLVPLVYLSGAARSIGFTGYMAMQYIDVPPTQMPDASPLSNALHQLATAVGIAVTVWLLSLFAGQISGGFTLTICVMAAALAVTVLWLARLPKQIGKVAS